VTFSFPFIVTMQMPVPEQEPAQPANVEPAAGVAVRATMEPLMKLAEHKLPQLVSVIGGLTVPLPLPESVTVSVNSS
jgi:hypothetical protein